MMTKSQKITLAVVIIIILILIIAIAAFIGTGTIKVNPQMSDKKKASEPTAEMKEKQSEEAALETQKLIEEVKEIAEKVEATEEAKGYAEVINLSFADDYEGEGTSTVAKVEGLRIAPGASIINLETGDVVNDDGEVVDNSAPIGSPEAPRQSQYIHDEDKLPESSIVLEIGADYIEPKTFTVKKGQAVSLVVKAVSERGGLLKFKDPSLSGVAVSLMPNRTKTITFNAPTKAGEYAYFSDYGRQESLGAVGVMTVE